MSAPRMLSELLRGIAVTPPAADTVVCGLTLDSRRVRPGDVFVALRGGSTHGIAFAPAALALGASAILAEAPAPAATPTAASAGDSEFPFAGNGAGRPEAAAGGLPADAPVLWIDRLRAHVGEIAARFYGRPSAALRVIGVTGTNGKTSTVQLLGGALQSLGARAATIGTLGAGLVGAIAEGERTTPDVISVQGLLAQFRDGGASDVAMEVSSHALDQGRVDAVAFRLAVFTNLTRDHLDYHGDMTRYGAAKARLFAWPTLQSAIVNVDDAFGRELAAALPNAIAVRSEPADAPRPAPRLQCIRYGIESADADVRARDIRSGGDGLRFTLDSPWGTGEIASPLLGRFNVANLLAVAACLGALGYTFAQIAGALALLQPVAGRMNRIGGGDFPLVVVDYAHTPDALEQALASLRAHAEGRLLCVFGCGGERDRGKRPQMGAIAERLADRIVVTDDNPRGEDGDAIVADIVAGLRRPQAAIVQRDRARAIALAIGDARPGDIVLIAGKGHEPYQEIAGRKLAFDDAGVARRTLGARPC